ncbi:hypothetical protein DO70_1653 [Burkholderia pseudomallei]|nr:hypothetical protein DO70_1653 [Burkholderia pseudomallei]
MRCRASLRLTSVGGAGLDDETGRFPFRKAALETSGLEASGTQGSHGLECKYTVRAAAIRHDFRVGRELAQAGLQRGQRDIERARQMPLCELVMWAHVQQGDQTVRKTRGQPISRYRLHRIARMEIARNCENDDERFADVREAGARPSRARRAPQPMRRNAPMKPSPQSK